MRSVSENRQKNNSGCHQWWVPAFDFALDSIVYRGLLHHPHGEKAFLPGSVLVGHACLHFLHFHLAECGLCLVYFLFIKSSNLSLQGNFLYILALLEFLSYPACSSGRVVSATSIEYRLFDLFSDDFSLFGFLDPRSASDPSRWTAQGRKKQAECSAQSFLSGKWAQSNRTGFTW